jgi:type II secretory pathway pseudopilin PulG
MWGAALAAPHIRFFATYDQMGGLVRMESTEDASSRSDEAGMGMVEIVVSMFLLAIVAMSFLPVLIQGMRGTVTNATAATAGQLVSQQIDAARALPANCASLSAFDDIAVPSTTDARGTVFYSHRQVGACPATYPGVVAVRVWITEGASTTVTTEAKTLVYVSSAVAP